MLDLDVQIAETTKNKAKERRAHQALLNFLIERQKHTSRGSVEWKRLQQSDNFAFSDYANFLLLHPGWPGETSRRAAAESAAGPGMKAGAVRTSRAFRGKQGQDHL